MGNGVWRGERDGYERRLSGRMMVSRGVMRSPLKREWSCGRGAGEGRGMSPAW